MPAGAGAAGVAAGPSPLFVPKLDRPWRSGCDISLSDRAGPPSRHIAHLRNPPRSTSRPGEDLIRLPDQLDGRIGRQAAGDGRPSLVRALDDEARSALVSEIVPHPGERDDRAIA